MRLVESHIACLTFRISDLQFKGLQQFPQLHAELHDGLSLMDVEELFCVGEASRVALDTGREENMSSTCDAVG